MFQTSINEFWKNMLLFKEESKQVHAFKPYMIQRLHHKVCYLKHENDSNSIYNVKKE